ncbi:hypothetical protein [Undibacterium sp. Tian12W]|uniref:hypothetical protein n=1 Tax=Undibacterium sp. Tian12W TaxID=3413054 RepID=UPI003BF3FFFF
MKIFLILLINVLFVVNAQARPINERQPQVISCEQLTSSKPGLGRAFQGSITNDDYAFSAVIPAGLTGWDGVDQSASFHGFTIFLNSQISMCINFEIHRRIDEKDTPVPSWLSKSISLGDAQAWQSSRSQKNKKTGMTNVSTLFSFNRGNQIYDGEIILIAPTAEITGAKSIYDKFITTLVFHSTL